MVKNFISIDYTTKTGRTKKLPSGNRYISSNLVYREEIYFKITVFAVATRFDKLTGSMRFVSRMCGSHHVRCRTFVTEKNSKQTTQEIAIEHEFE